MGVGESWPLGMGLQILGTCVRRLPRDLSSVSVTCVLVFPSWGNPVNSQMLSSLIRMLSSDDKTHVSIGLYQFLYFFLHCFFSPFFPNLFICTF